MLVLSRKPNESIIISNNIEVKIVEVKGDYVKLGITAPKEISVHRKEVFEAIQRENMQAAQSQVRDIDALGDILHPKSQDGSKQKPDSGGKSFPSTEGNKKPRKE